MKALITYWLLVLGLFIYSLYHNEALPSPPKEPQKESQQESKGPLFYYFFNEDGDYFLCVGSEGEVPVKDQWNSNCITSFNPRPYA